MIAKALEQFARDLQGILANATTAGVYEGEAPRGADETVLTGAAPFVVYTCDVASPMTERGDYTANVFIDVWALDSWANAYQVAGDLHEALNGFVGVLECGRVSIDPNGAIMTREARDPDNERVRRLHSQYVAVLYPKI
jgi:hypothetical protein